MVIATILSVWKTAAWSSPMMIPALLILKARGELGVTGHCSSSG
jgi:hypothetical protein